MSYSELKNKSVKCRKEHVCCWCGARIEVGENAQNRSYVFDGNFNNDYLHPDCNDAMIDTDNHYLEDGWEFGMFNRGQRAEEFE